MSDTCLLAYILKIDVSNVCTCNVPIFIVFIDIFVCSAKEQLKVGYGAI